MYTFIRIGDFMIPSYGLMISLGVIIANLVAWIINKKIQLDFNDFILLEACCFLGSFIGAKVLYLIVAYKEIEWYRIFEIDYLNHLMLTGFVFYGGLIGGLLSVIIAGKLSKIDAYLYINHFIFLLPLLHGF